MSTVTVETEVQQLKDEIVRLKADVYTLQRNQSSRVGPQGGRGPVGPSGKDAVIQIVQADGKVQIVDMEGRVHAELVPVAGKDGRDGEDGVSTPGKDGAPGKPGKDAPSLDEIVRGVLQAVKAKL